MKPKLTIDILTLFPKMFDGPFRESLLGRAQQAGAIEVRIHDLRRWSDDPRHAKVDDRPFGGGAGMVIRAEPVYRALKDLGAMKSRAKPWVVFLSPQGETLSQKTAERLASRKRVILVCGHYEGVDERAMEWVDQELSIGDFVLTGGELPAMVVADVVARLVPGVVGDPSSLERDSFSSGLLDYPHYTRPSLWRGRKVPPVLLSGNHAEIEKWRRQEAVRRTKARRPDLLKSAGRKQI
jgi:tRNA (guanine37-N1)-methyltransferase